MTTIDDWRIFDGRPAVAIWNGEPMNGSGIATVAMVRCDRAGGNVLVLVLDELKTSYGPADIAEFCERWPGAAARVLGGFVLFLSGWADSEPRRYSWRDADGVEHVVGADGAVLYYVRSNRRGRWTIKPEAADAWTPDMLPGAALSWVGQLVEAALSDPGAEPEGGA